MRSARTIYERVTMAIFKSFFLGGFECATQRLRTGEQLDLTAATRHDRFALSDYRLLRRHGIRTARDGLRWHLIETRQGWYDWSSFLPMLRASQQAGVQVVWDLFHYGCPEHIDIWQPAFVERFARFAGAVTRLMCDETGCAPLLCPINEISFVSWAGGDTQYLNPFGRGRGMELKTQLVRATIAAIEAIWDVEPAARIALIDPIIHIVPAADRPQDAQMVADYVMAQYQSWDMIAGREWPGLGGSERYLDVIGVNYYWNNQWVHEGPPLEFGQPGFRPVRDMLSDIYQRYRRPLFVAETGIEGEQRPAWLRMIGEEARAALACGVALEGVCLYPILDYPGWDDGRQCETGLYCAADERGARQTCLPLAAELARQRRLLDLARGRTAQHDQDLEECDALQSMVMDR
jgi:beta-glucosidase/6-phospho-beta-glucosidase/beta-galactosidase